MISENFVYLGAAISFVGGLSYVIATLKGRTKPNRVSWFLWFLAPMIAVASQLDQGVRAQVLLTFMAGFNPFLVLVATFISHKAKWNITRFDYYCGAASIVGIILWLATDQPNLAILFSIVADGLAAIPTLKKSYTNPETENPNGFIASAIAAGLTLLTIDIWNFEHYAFSLYIFVICVILASLIVFRPRGEEAA